MGHRHTLSSLFHRIRNNHSQVSFTSAWRNFNKKTKWFDLLGNLAESSAERFLLVWANFLHTIDLFLTYSVIFWSKLDHVNWMNLEWANRTRPAMFIQIPSDRQSINMNIVLIWFLVWFLHPPFLSRRNSLNISSRILHYHLSEAEIKIKSRYCLAAR